MTTTPTALTPTFVVDTVTGHVTVTVTGARPGAATEIHLSPAVLRRARDGQVPPTTLIACALAEPGDLDQSWSPSAVGHGRIDNDLLEAHRRSYRMTNAARNVEKAINQSPPLDVLVIGKHGSGKTAIAAARAAAWRLTGGDVIWLDLSDSADGAESVYDTLLRTPRNSRYLLVIDGLQSNVEAIDRILQSVDDLRRIFGLAVTVLATTLPSLVEVDQRRDNRFSPFRSVRVLGRELIDLLTRGENLDAATAGRIQALAEGDAHLAADAIAYLTEHGRVPNRVELRSQIVRDVTDPGQQATLYWFACMGFFEIDVPVVAAERAHNGTVLSALRQGGHIFRDGSSYSIGHRYRAELVLRHAVQEWDAERMWGRPEDLAWRHLQTVGESLIAATLGRLDLLAMAGGQDTRSAETRYLAAAWDRLSTLVRQLRRLCRDDPTWRNCVAAAAFAGMSFAEVNDRASWETTARYVREQWHYDSQSRLPTPVGEHPGDIADFAAIIEAMREEDRQRQELLDVAPAEPADSVDNHKFRCTWMLGVLLSFEAKAMDENSNRLEDLVKMAEQCQDEKGFFYPRRAPWVTARIVIGLYLAGRGYDDSTTVRRACDWLRRSANDGGPFAGWWRSGTGSWNSDELASAMCLTALMIAEAPAQEQVQSGLAWLDGQEYAWGGSGHEVDRAFAVAAMLLADRRRHPMYDHILALLQWVIEAISQGGWRTGPEGRHSVPFLAAQLASIVWTMVQRDLRALLGDLLRRENLGEPTDPPEESGPQSGPIPPPPCPSDPAGVSLSPHDLEEWRNATAMLRHKLTTDIDNRQVVLRKVTPQQVARRMQERKYDRARCLELSRQLAEITRREVLVELDRLGRQYCGEAWHDLPGLASPRDPGDDWS